MQVAQLTAQAMPAGSNRPHTKISPEELAERRAAREAQAIEEDRKAREARMAEGYRQKLGKRFRNRTFTNYDKTINPQNADKADICQRYANREDFTDGNGILIMGKSNGAGKTHLAAAICNRLLDRGIPCLYDTWVGHLARLQAEFTADGPKNYRDRLKTVKVLILDDVGKEKTSEWTQSVMFDVINARYEADRPVIITTNLTDEELSAYLGPATYSRICEMCPTVKIEGEDYRLR